MRAAPNCTAGLSDVQVPDVPWWLLHEPAGVIRPNDADRRQELRAAFAKMRQAAERDNAQDERARQCTRDNS